MCFNLRVNVIYWKFLVAKIWNFIKIIEIIRKTILNFGKSYIKVSIIFPKVSYLN